jgi:hypothetical protein
LVPGQSETRSFNYHFQDRFRICFEIAVCDSDDSDADVREFAIAMCVVLGIVAGSVQFDRDPRTVTVEIHDEAGDHLLAAEM